MLVPLPDSGSNYRRRGKDFSNPSPIVPIPDQDTGQQVNFTEDSPEIYEKQK